MTSSPQIIQFVSARFGNPNEVGWRPVASPRPPPLPTSTVQECAAFLVRDAEFRSLQLGTWLNTPDGRLIESAVEQALPFPFNREAALISQAMRLAAERQHAEGIAKAGQGAALALLGGLVLVGLTRFVGQGAR